MAEPSALMELAGPFGAVGHPQRIATDGWMPNECSIYAAFTGNPSAVIGPYRPDARAGYGTGRAYDDPDRARLLAVAEALERYAGLVVDERRLTLASAYELGSGALDLDRVPRCSARELSRAGCPVQAADRTRPIRWTEATDLHTGQGLLVPAVMAFLKFPELRAENFWIPISTGCAVHRSFEAAVVGAICEVIERDAIALTWLQRLALPLLADSRLSPAARSIVRWCAERGIESHLYDATTDLGVPVVYCLQTTETVARTGQLVGAACGFDVHSLAEHALLETMGLRPGIQARRRLPRRYADHRSVEDGAAVMAGRARRDAFRFLLDDLGARPVSALLDHGPASDRERLDFLLRRLARLDMTALAVDLTTRELRDSGHVAVRVLIPELQPMSARPLVQYRGHGRLYSAPGRMGFRAHPERRLNPYPQPMA